MHFYNDRVCVSFCGENMEIYILCSLFATDDMLFLGVICIEHLVFYRLFQLINSSNKPIPVCSYQCNQYHMYTSMHVTC